MVAAERAALLSALLDRLEPHRRAAVVAYELDGWPWSKWRPRSGSRSIRPGIAFGWAGKTCAPRHEK